MVREATYADTQAILALLDEGYHRSKYKEYTLDTEVARQLIHGALQRTKVRGEGGTCVYVYENRVVLGVMVGILDRIYHVAKELMATDLFFYVSKDCSNPRAFVGLLRAFENWAWGNSKVKKIDLGVTNIIGDPSRLGIFYKRNGYIESGLMFEKFRAESF